MRKAESDRLAVVGGGPSIHQTMEMVRAFDGEVWAINGAYWFLKEHGIEATFFSIDPSVSVARYVNSSVKRAVISTFNAPEVFELLKGADLCVADLDVLGNGPTTSTTAPHISLEMGHRHITFFGCEGSFPEKGTHAYANCVPPDSYLMVKVGGHEFRSSPDMLMQAEFLAELIRAAPGVYAEESGGLLRALIANSDYDITAATQDIHEQLKVA